MQPNRYEPEMQHEETYFKFLIIKTRLIVCHGLMMIKLIAKHEQVQEKTNVKLKNLVDTCMFTTVLFPGRREKYKT